jgi:sorbitol-specific phosphotransferase system component IIC
MKETDQFPKLVFGMIFGLIGLVISSLMIIYALNTASQESAIMQILNTTGHMGLYSYGFMLVTCMTLFMINAIDPSQDLRQYEPTKSAPKSKEILTIKRQ